MSKEEAIGLMEESKWLVGKMVGGLRVAFVNVLPLYDHPSFGDILVCLYGRRDHWHLMGGVSDFKVHVFFAQRPPFIPGNVYPHMDVLEAKQKAD